MGILIEGNELLVTGSGEKIALAYECEGRQTVKIKDIKKADPGLFNKISPYISIGEKYRVLKF